MGLSKKQQIVFIKGVTRALARQFTSLDNPGFCYTCGEERDGCEPDAIKYECPSCGASEVRGLMYAIDHPVMRTEYAKKHLNKQIDLYEKERNRLKARRRYNFKMEQRIG
tara:strand:+ start:126 stop:455 length:330 start_codon:yes stop_codon:yes gene_type:complete